MIYKRRDFLRWIYNASIATTLSPLLLPQEIYADSSNNFDDYKVIVHILLNGGNDAFNMVVADGSRSDLGMGYSYDNYASIRSDLSISNSSLNINLSNGKVDLSGGNPYSTGANSNADSYRRGIYNIDGTGIGINGLMPEVAQMMRDEKLAVLANIGTLVQPVTKDQIQARSARLPIYLFSHNTQRDLQAGGRADKSLLTGWAGRVSDSWSNINGGDVLGNNISFSGNDLSLVGKRINPLILTTNPVRYDMDSAEQQMRKSIYQISSDSHIKNYINRIIGRSHDLADKLMTQWSSSEQLFDGLSDSYGNPLFSIPDKNSLNFNSGISGSLIKRVEAIAKMIDYGRNHGVKRQIFFVELGGFDTHNSQLNNHPTKLRELSLAIDKLQRAIDSFGLTDKVTGFTTTDFGRTAASNGDGTDHAWAGHNLVFGGAVKGGLYGAMPDLTLEGVQDYGKNGRIIPTISVEQQLSTITKWFGVDDTLMEELFPNIGNFSSRDLGFMTPS